MDQRAKVAGSKSKVVWGVGSRLVSAIVFVVFGVSCTRNDEPGEAGAMVELGPEGRFRLITPELVSCEDVFESSAGKVRPSHEEVEELLGEGNDTFVVQMKQDIDNEAYPLTGGTGNPVPDAQIQARASHVAGLQACAVSYIESIGGTYTDSSWLINAFTATLSSAQADQVSRRSDVQSAQLSIPAPLP